MFFSFRGFEGAQKSRAEQLKWKKSFDRCKGGHCELLQLLFEITYMCGGVCCTHGIAFFKSS